MKSIIFLLLTIFIFNIPQDRYRPTAALCLAGGIIKSAQSNPIESKYKRKDCPVCKGKGWYLSGDGLAKVECGYCVEDTEEGSVLPTPPPAKPPAVIIKPPVKKSPIRHR